MANLLAETLDELKDNKKISADVRWVAVQGSPYADGRKAAPCGSWDDFASFANFDYESGYGGAEVNRNLVIVGDDWWLERGGYDGGEWWEFKALPQKPKRTAPLREGDLKDH